MSDEEKTVLAFLREWLAWAEAGAPEGGRFFRYDGLCNSFDRWPGSGEYDLSDWFVGVDCTSYPFGGTAAYKRDFDNDTMHLNPLRLAWVRETIAKLENENGQ